MSAVFWSWNWLIRRRVYGRAGISSGARQILFGVSNKFAGNPRTKEQHDGNSTSDTDHEGPA
jgi:hypothetical protein